jgi:hypothetical protein
MKNPDADDLPERGQRLATAEEIAAATGISVSHAQLMQMIDSHARYYLLPDGPAEQRSAMADSFGERVCRWETVKGVRNQVVYDRDGNEDTRMLLLGQRGDGE